MTEAHDAGVRAARNTFSRAAAEIIGKLASLVLFAALARETGEAGLGAFVFAFAFLQVATVPVDLGYDRYLVRRVAHERAEAASLLVDVVTLKLVRTLPVAGVSVVLLEVLDYSAQAKHTVYALAAGMVLDTLSRSVFAVFTAYERSELLAASLIVQRFTTAGLGLVALAAGYGVVTVAAMYTIGAGLGLVIALVLLTRRLGLPRLRPLRSRWRKLTRESMPFAVQDVFTVILFKVDALILSLMATQAAVGRYGAAYRLFESTMFITISLAGAFSAMYTYLGPDTAPPLRSVFQRSVKLAMASLVPVAIVFGLLAEPLSRAIFGAGLEDAAASLRLLAPCVVLLGVVTLSASLYVSRLDPRPMVKVTAVMAAINVALNIALIPAFDETGAAAAMLVTEAAYCAVSLTMAARVVGGVDWLTTMAGPLLAGAIMVAPALLLADSLAPAMLAAGAVYLVALAALERMISPADFNFAAGLLRRVLRLRPAT
jgi:O-antigen/teichoic acid export membrane protein